MIRLLLITHVENNDDVLDVDGEDEKRDQVFT